LDEGKEFPLCRLLDYELKHLDEIKGITSPGNASRGNTSYIMHPSRRGMRFKEMANTAEFL
jgi:hypothetical protein